MSTCMHVPAALLHPAAPSLPLNQSACRQPSKVLHPPTHRRSRFGRGCRRGRSAGAWAGAWPQRTSVEGGRKEGRGEWRGACLDLAASAGLNADSAQSQPGPHRLALVLWFLSWCASSKSTACHGIDSTSSVHELRRGREGQMQGGGTQRMPGSIQHGRLAGRQRRAGERARRKRRGAQRVSNSIDSQQAAVAHDHDLLLPARDAPDRAIRLLAHALAHPAWHPRVRAGKQWAAAACRHASSAHHPHNTMQPPDVPSPLRSPEGAPRVELAHPVVQHGGGGHDEDGEALSRE